MNSIPKTSRSHHHLVPNLWRWAAILCVTVLLQGCGSLPKTIRAHNTAKALKMIERGADVNQFSMTAGWVRPLQVAAAEGDFKVVQALVEKGATINLTNIYAPFRPPLHEAAGRNSADLVTYFLEHGAEVDLRDWEGLTALHATIPLGAVRSARVLLEHKANPNDRGTNGPILLQSALNRNSLPMIRLLLDHGADPNLASSNAAPPLIQALMNDRMELASLLLEKGAHPNGRDAVGRTPLAWSLLRGQRAFARRLLAGGADEKLASRTGRLPLHAAAADGDLELVTLFLSRGGDANAATTEGWTPLHAAAGVRGGATNGEALPMVKLLLERGARVNAVDERVFTPLDASLSGGLATNAITQALFEAGATDNITKRNPGETGINHAAVAMHLEARGEWAQALALYEKAATCLDQAASLAAGESRKDFWREVFSPEAYQGGIQKNFASAAQALVPGSNRNYATAHAAKTYKGCAADVRKRIAALQSAGPR